MDFTHHTCPEEDGYFPISRKGAVYRFVRCNLHPLSEEGLYSAKLLIRFEAKLQKTSTPPPRQRSYLWRRRGQNRQITVQTAE